jgi:hypothetical protein
VRAHTLLGEPTVKYHLGESTLLAKVTGPDKKNDRDNNAVEDDGVAAATPMSALSDPEPLPALFTTVNVREERLGTISFLQVTSK